MSADRSLAVRIPSSQATSLATRRDKRLKSELSAVPNLNLLPSYSLINLLRIQLHDRILIATSDVLAHVRLMEAGHVE